MTIFAMTGATGRLGQYFLNEDVVPLKCDITQPETVIGEVHKLRPDAIIHLASISDVDYCQDPKNLKKLYDVNVRGTWTIARVAKEYNIPIVMLSTDHVFSGKRGWFPPYNEKTKHTPRNLPINQYGISKLIAEGFIKDFKNMKIVRTSYLFDKKRLQAVAKKSVPTFMYRSFMYIPHFVSSFMQYLYNLKDMPDILHISGSKTVSWDTFMSEYAGAGNYKAHDKDKQEYAPRPHRGGLRTLYPFFPKRNYIQGLQDMKNA